MQNNQNIQFLSELTAPGIVFAITPVRPIRRRRP